MGNNQSFWIPWPPTANTMFGLQGHRRFISKKYADWKSLAGDHLMQQQPVKMDGPINVFIHLTPPSNRKWDLDNRVKPVLDLLVTYQIIEDDNASIVRRIDVRADDKDSPGARISLEGIEIAEPIDGNG